MLMLFTYNIIYFHVDLTTMDNLEVGDMAFPGSTMEHLGFTDSDPAVSAFLAGGLPTDTPRSANVQVTTTSTDSMLSPSSLVLGDDQTPLGGNLQIGLDLAPITNAAGTIFDTGTEPFMSMATTTSEIMEGNATYTGMMSQQPPTPVHIDSTHMQEEQLQSVESIANMNLAIHNYAGPVNGQKDCPVNTLVSSPIQPTVSKVTNGTNPPEGKLAPARVEIKTVDPNSSPNMLLVYDKVSGKNILLPIAGSTAAPTVNFQQPEPEQEKDMSSMGTITINVGDFLNILNQAGKRVVPVEPVESETVPAPELSPTFTVQLGAGFGKNSPAGESLSQLGTPEETGPLSSIVLSKPEHEAQSKQTTMCMQQPGSISSSYSLVNTVHHSGEVPLSTQGSVLLASSTPHVVSQHMEDVAVSAHHTQESVLVGEVNTLDLSNEIAEAEKNITQILQAAVSEGFDDQSPLQTTNMNSATRTFEMHGKLK